MKLQVLLVIAMVAVAAHAQEIRVVRVMQMPEPHTTGFRPLSLFPSLLTNMPSPVQQAPDFPDFLKSMMSLDNPFQGVEEPEPQQQEEQQFEREAEEIASGMMSRIMGRMSGLMQSLLKPEEDQQEAQPEPVVFRIRVRVCPFMAACGDDVDQFCARARLSEIEGAVTQCLKEHADDISDQCRSMLDEKEAHEHNDEQQPEQEPEDSEESDEDTDDERPVPEQRPEQQPEQQPEPEQQPQKPSVHRFGKCMSDSERLCPSATSLVEVMACLHAHKSDVSEECLEAVGQMPIFNCGEDVQRMCPDARGRTQVAQCLKEKSGLSTECLHSIRQFHQKNLPQTYKGHRVYAKDPVASVSHKTQQVHEDANEHKKKKMYAIAGLSFVGFVALVAVVAFVKRRRRRQYEQIEDSEQHIQLAPPVVNLASPIFEATPEEEL